MNSFVFSICLCTFPYIFLHLYLSDQITTSVTYTVLLLTRIELTETGIAFQSEITKKLDKIYDPTILKSVDTEQQDP